jgi:phage-related protein
MSTNMSPWRVVVIAEARAELADWPVELRASLTRIVERIEAVGLDRIGEPSVKHIEGKLWEMRPSGRGIEGRALYVAASGRRVVIVLAFQKTTRKTPRRMIELALRRAERPTP